MIEPLHIAALIAVASSAGWTDERDVSAVA
jgi:hypothetical protein